MPSRDEQLNALSELEAYRQGHFILASGKHSAHYIQAAQLGRQPRALQRIIDAKASELTALQPELVFAAAIGGITMGYQVGLSLDLPAIFAERNADNALILRRGFTIAPGQRVLLIEDVVTTGGTLGELAEIVEQSGGVVAGVYAVINRSGQKIWREHPFLASFELDFPVFLAEECPLCRDGAIPARRPGSKKVP